MYPQVSSAVLQGASCKPFRRHNFATAASNFSMQHTAYRLLGVLTLHCDQLHRSTRRKNDDSVKATLHDPWVARLSNDRLTPKVQVEER